MPLPPNPRIGQLRAQGGYSDVYHDEYIEYADFLGLFASKTWPFSTDYFKVSGIFVFQAETQEEDDDIWAAITTTWNNRALYATIEDLRLAMNDALEAAGYTAPNLGPIL